MIEICVRRTLSRETSQRTRAGEEAGALTQELPLIDRPRNNLLVYLTSPSNGFTTSPTDPPGRWTARRTGGWTGGWTGGRTAGVCAAVGPPSLYTANCKNWDLRGIIMKLVLFTVHNILYDDGGGPGLVHEVELHRHRRRVGAPSTVSPRSSSSSFSPGAHIKEALHKNYRRWAAPFPSSTHVHL